MLTCQPLPTTNQFSVCMSPFLKKIPYKWNHTVFVYTYCCSSVNHVRFFATLGLQQARLPYPSPSPEACSNSGPLSQWCHPTVLSSVIPFSSCPQCFQASGSILMSWLFLSGGQSIGASTAVCLMNIQNWFPLGLTGLIYLLSKGLSRVFSMDGKHGSKASILRCSLYGPTLTSIHDYWKNHRF